MPGGIQYRSPQHAASQKAGGREAGEPELADPKKTGGTFQSRRVLTAMIAATLVSFVGLAFYAWSEFGDVELGINGYLALTAGVLGTAAVGIGLMLLVFYSDRAGYDDEAAKTLTKRDSK